LDLKFKRQTDFILGRVLLFATKLLARGLGFFLRRNHNQVPARRILIMKFQGMGSLAIAKHALADLHNTFPEAQIWFWGTPSTTQLAKLFPEFHNVLDLNDKNILTAAFSLVGNLIRIWRFKPDWVFDLEVYSRLSSVLATLTCGKNRAGFAIDVVHSRRSVHTHLMYFNRYVYLGVAYQQLLNLCGISEEHSKKNQIWNFDTNPLPLLKKPYLVFNPHTGPLAPERQWPLEKAKTFINEFSKAYPNHPVVLIGHGEDEIAVCKNLESSATLNLAGRLSLEQTISCLSHASLVVSADSGPLHLAILCDTPTVALFGPTRAETYVDLSRSNLKVITKNIYCSPCVHHWWPPPCRGDNQCMKTIDTSEVLTACSALIGQAKGHFTSSSRKPQSREISGFSPGLIYAKKSG
jgi:ADP-heptose:LPS heptosyltransferase